MRYQNYHMITFSERLTIEAMVKEGKKKTEIAKVIGCHRETIRREIERGSKDGSYDAAYAQSMLNMPKNAKTPE